MGFEVHTSRNWFRSNASFWLTSVFQGSVVFPHRLALCLNRKAPNRPKITGIAQLLFLSLAFICQTRYDMNDVRFICHVESIFWVNKCVALVAFNGRDILNASGGGQRQNELYFALWSCETLQVVSAQDPQKRRKRDSVRGVVVYILITDEGGRIYWTYLHIGNSSF